MVNKAIELAEKYEIHIFPCKKNKAPFTKRGFHDASSDPEQIKEWWGWKPGASIGISTHHSGIAVLDIDVKNGGFNSLERLQCVYGDEWMNDCPQVRTQGGGLHFYFANNLSVGSCVLKEGIDLKALNGYVIAPPSIGEKGSYEWLVPLEDHWPLPPLPFFISKELSLQKINSSRKKVEYRQQKKIFRGERNSYFTSLCGKFLRNFYIEDLDVVPSYLEYVNQNYSETPLSSSELSKIFNSISKKEIKRRSENEN